MDDLFTLQGAIQAGGILIAIILIMVFNRNTREDRKVFTNHLSGLLQSDIDSRDKNTEALTKLSVNIAHLNEGCASTQKDFNETQNELKNTVDKLDEVFRGRFG